MRNGLIIDANGTKYWYLNDRLHREDGPAVERANGTKEWWLNGKYHREDGPAFEGANGNKSWYLNGKRHREDGPAIEYANGTKAWYLNGREFSEKEWAWLIDKKVHVTKEDLLFPNQEIKMEYLLVFN